MHKGVSRYGALADRHHHERIAVQFDQAVALQRRAELRGKPT
jgi:hypothetical protein